MPSAIIAARAASTNPSAPAEAQHLAATGIQKAIAAARGAQSLGEPGDSPERLLDRAVDVLEGIARILAAGPLTSDAASEQLYQVHDAQALLEGAVSLDAAADRKTVSRLALQLAQSANRALDRSDWPMP